MELDITEALLENPDVLRALADSPVYHQGVHMTLGQAAVLLYMQRPMPLSIVTERISSEPPFTLQQIHATDA